MFMTPINIWIIKMKKVTACLISWKRPQNIHKIIDSLMQWSFINEIIVRDNSKSKNIINFGRYTSAKKAKNRIIFTQDDDCVVENLDEVYEKFISDPTCISHSGIQGYADVLKDNIYGDAQMAMAGWGSFFKKEWIPVLDKYVERYGKDECFYRETDRIFSMLLNKHHNFTLGKITMLDGVTGPEALSSQGNHLKFKQLAIERCLGILNES